MPRRCPATEDVAIYKGMGLAIAEVREAHGLSKSAVAARAGISPSSFGQIEFGTADAKWGTLRKLASALEIPLDALAEMAEGFTADLLRAEHPQPRSRGASRSTPSPTPAFPAGVGPRR